VTPHTLLEADAEVQEAILWYEGRRSGLGDGFVRELAQTFERIGQNPRSLALLEYYSGPHEIRRYLMRRFPYAVVYECRADEALVVAVAHLHREPLYWLGRLDD